jgi:lysozyme family protein
MKSNYAKCLELVLKHEGGFVHHKRDPGGATNFGVTQAVYDEYRRRNKLAVQSVRHITSKEVSDIYRNQYWDAVKADELPEGVDYTVFDFAVNSGVRRSAQFLQRAVGVVDDGKIGPMTLAAVRGRKPGDVIQDINAARLAFLRRLPTWDAFGRGWARRVRDVLAISLSMAGGR